MSLLAFTNLRFRILDTISPLILNTTPVDNTINVALGVSPIITYNELIQPGTGLLTLRRNIGGTFTDVETFNVVTQLGTANGQVNFSGSSVTINPTANLVADSEYSIRIASTAVRDSAGNFFAGILNDTTLSFTATPGIAPTFTTLTVAENLITYAVTGPATIHWSIDNVDAPTGSVIDAGTGSYVFGSFNTTSGINDTTIDLTGTPTGARKLHIVSTSVNNNNYGTPQHFDITVLAGDVAAPVLTDQIATSTGPSTSNASVTTNEAAGILYAVRTLSATTPSKAQVKAGQNHLSVAASHTGSLTITTIGSKSISATGLNPSTVYYTYFMQEDISGNQSTVVATNSITTAAADLTAPILTVATGAPIGATTATGNVTTNEANGVLYRVTSTLSSAPSKAQVKLGQNSNGSSAVATSNQIVTATGVQTMSTISGLTASTTYYNYFMHEDSSGNQSDVLSSASFATTAAPAWSYDAVKGVGSTANFYEINVPLTGVTAGQKLFGVVTTGSDRIITTPSGWSLYQRAGAPANKSGFAPFAVGDVEILIFTKTAVGNETSVLFSELNSAFISIYATVFAVNGNGRIGSTTPMTAFNFGNTVVAPDVTVSEGAYRVSVFSSEGNANTFTPPSGGAVLRTPTEVYAHLLWIEGPLSAGQAGTKSASQTAVGRANACSIELEPI